MIQYNTANGTQVHKYVYDGLNRLTKYTDALNHSETYTYDSNNDIIKKVDRNGITTNYTYDGLHRMLTESVKKDSVTTTNTYVYGATGGIVSENAKNVKYSNTVLSDVTKTYTYNSVGLPSTETTKIGNDSFRINRYYDTRGNDREDSYYKNGTLYRKMKYVYDNKNRLFGVYDVDINTGTQSMKAQYGYDKNDNNNLIHYGNGGATITTFNAANLPVRLYNSNGSTIYSDFTYNYKLDGNVASKTEKMGGNSNTVTYTYDNSGRLSSEGYKGADSFSINYTYDNAGNRKTASFSGEDVITHTEKYTYDLNNRLTKIVDEHINSNPNVITEYKYDNNGNQLETYKYNQNRDGIFKVRVISAMYKNDTGMEKFTYNGLNQLIEYSDTNGKYNGKTGLNASYVYMANGYRLSKTVNGEETKYLWDKDNIVSELNSENVRIQTYYRGYNLISDDTNRYYMHNAHGDVVEVFTGKNEGNIYYYNAFGTTSHYENTEIPNKWGYCDQLKDFETGNYYMRARYYNPDTGRFISEDPIKDGSNWYSYCGGNPVMFWDPNGLRMKIDDDSRTSKGNVSTDEIQTVVDSMNILLCGEANIFIDRYGVLHLRDVVEGASGAGYRLIKELIDAQDTFNIGIVNEKTANIYKTSIAETSKYNNTKKLIKFNPNVYSNAVVGFENVVTVNGKPLYGNMVHEKVTDIEKRKAVSLGHELVHALRDKRGLYFADGETTTYSGTRPIIGRKFWSKAPIIASDEIIKEEFMTVGLIEWNGGNNGRITENDLRRQLGMPLRHWY